MLLSSTSSIWNGSCNVVFYFFSNCLMNFLIFQCKQVTYMERTSNSDIEILIKIYHTAEFDGALKIAFYLKNWLILITRNLDTSYTSIKIITTHFGILLPYQLSFESTWKNKTLLKIVGWIQMENKKCNNIQTSTESYLSLLHGIDNHNKLWILLGIT